MSAIFYRAQTLFVVLVVVAGALALLLSWVLGVDQTDDALSTELIIDAYKDHIVPEPTEQTIFAVLAVLIPTLAFFITLMAPEARAVSPRDWRHSMPVVVAVLFFLPFFLGTDFTVTVLGRYNVQGSDSDLATLALMVGLLASICWCYWFIRPQSRTQTIRWRPWKLPLAWLLFALAVTLQLLSWRLVSFASVTSGGVWSTHADPVFFALSQVVAGKTLLVDLPSQYGLFPEMVAPLFSVIGLSVLKLSTFFALMQAASMGALFFVMSQLLKSRFVLTIVGLALVMLTFETVIFFVGIDERYFQYWPVRFFWPAASVLVFYWFACNRTLARGATMSLLSAIGVLWNFDSGLFIVIAFGAYLIARWLILITSRREMDARGHSDKWSSRTYATFVALHVGIVSLVVVTSFLVLRLKAGQPLDLPDLFEYQRVFAKIGLMMLPLPRIVHPWMSLLGVYLIGFLFSIGAWRRKTTHLSADVTFYLCMLGLGLFVYYVGRSHVLNLVTVCWPALLIAAIGADAILRAVRAHALSPAHLALPMVGLALFFVAAVSFVARVPFLLEQMTNRFEGRGRAEDALVASELSMIRQYASKKRECLILSQRQGIYYAELGLASPLKGPGIVEILLKEDQKAITHAFLDGRMECVFLGIGGVSDAGLDIDLAKALVNYEIKGRNELDTMLYLEAKP